MATGPKARVNGPLLTPPRHSLFNSIDPTIDDDERWPNGFRFSPERCEGGGVVAPCVPTEKSLSAADNLANVEYEPFWVWAGAICNMLDPEFGGREGAARARRLLAASESKNAALEFWEGNLAQDQAWPNFYLTQAGATLLSTGGVDPEDALACLEQAIAECADNGIGVIHATRQVFTLWKRFNLITVETDWRAFTYLGNQVIADTGYTGTAPMGAIDTSGVSWAYATGQLQLRLGGISDVPPRLSQAVDRSTNDAIWRVERPVAITTDACCHAAVGVTVQECQNLEFGS